ncbi:hypothetical protein XU18_4481 [Perkinsela sp. CCAP 1560/4]|nr:hypothetical protein XU18_4481 [Perkinsela sp. CCAP 1560/4]|eukprot:KNH04271.1 hypothetical protein XU18_4481 [Perkinsela sp. CCAP 1560/4]
MTVIQQVASRRFRTIHIACFDNGIIGFDWLASSQQSLMELFFRFELERPMKYVKLEIIPTDISEWKGVVLNANREIADFQWNFKRGLGADTLDVQFLPCCMKGLMMACNFVSGTIQLAGLPGRKFSFFLTISGMIVSTSTASPLQCKKFIRV